MTDEFAPVAEYRNVAIMEQKGTKRSVWKGKEYKTDGFLYLFVSLSAQNQPLRGA
jgi:hypothetical protein